MASWRDRIKGGASFRGVPFHVDVAERSGGRRTVTHEYPLRDMSFVEDMGRRARTFPLEGYVLGETYLLQRDALIAALEGAGPGKLVHPYYGTRRVICTGFRIRESTADGGMARFSLDFEETEAAPAFPTVSPSGAAMVASSGAAALAALGDAFLAAYRVTGLPRAVVASASGIVRSAGGAMLAALSHVIRDTQVLAVVKRDVDELIADADAVARQPADLLAGFGGVFAAFGTAPLTRRLGVAALLAAYGFTPASARPPATTSTRLQERANHDALLRLVRSLAVVHAAHLAPDAVFDSYDAAVAVRDAIGDRLDEQLEGADDATFAALEQLRADLVRAVPGEETDLPRLVRYTPAYTVPSLVLAHQLYGDLSLEADLVARNRILRPGFVVGGTDLEVLARA
jgi:prophage DNA circulation protein